MPPQGSEPADESGPNGSGRRPARITGRKWGVLRGFLVGWVLSWAFMFVLILRAYDSFPTALAVLALLVLFSPGLFFLSPRNRTWFFIGLAAGSIVMGGMCLSIASPDL